MSTQSATSPDPDVKNVKEQDTRPRECRFAIHLPSRKSHKGPTPDLHLIKEIIHNPDGTTTPNIRYQKDRLRSFWVVPENYRDYEQKKEYEPFSRLMRFESTQSNLDRAVAQALGRGWANNPQLRQLSESPYLYGSDISSSALIKHEYATKWPDAVSPYRVAFFDTETDVLHGTKDPIIATLLFEGKLAVIVQESFLEGYANIVDRFNASNLKWIQASIEKHKLQIEFILVKDAVELIREVFKRVHAWSPDLLAIWNLDFDIPRIIETLEKYGVNPKDIFSDPKLPSELRFCKYKKGSTKKVTASGQVKPKNPSEQWHSLYCPAGFYIIDAMCSYRFIRQGAQEEQSYSLDAILKKEEVGEKLVLPGTEQYSGLELHEVMQSKHPFEYISYAIMDVVGMQDLELKTNDLSQALPVQAGFTDFSRFNSQTKRFADDFTFFLLDAQCVVGTIPPRKKEEEIEVDLDEPPSEDDDEEGTGEDDDSIVNEDGDVLVPRVEAKPEDSVVLSLKRWIN